MKTERRHELQTNELAIWLTKWIENIKPYWKGILGGIIVALVAFAAFYLVGNRQEQGRALAWQEYFRAFDAGDAEEFRKVGDAYVGTGAGMWALQSVGDASLASGAGQLFRDRDAAVEDLETARDAYQKVVDQVGSSDLAAEAKEMLKQRALFGLGQALESLGEFTEAEKQYQRVLDEFPPTAVAVSLAQDRIDALKLQSTRDWYAWLAEQKPAASPITSPGLFDNLPDLPDNPDLNLPNPGQLLTPGTDSTTPPSDALPSDALPSDALPSDALPGDTLPGDTLLEPSETTGDDLPLFGPGNSTDDDSPTLLELPADSPDTSTDTSADEGGNEDAVVGEGGATDGATTSDEASETTGDETTSDDSSSDEGAGDEDGS